MGSKLILKHRWSVGHNYLSGITAGDWWHLLKANRFAVSPAYWHRAAFISLLSVVNAWNRRREEKRFGVEIHGARLQKPPVFILGHWRSGTTHLHNLLAQDTVNFAYPNTYQVVNPHTFLTTEDKNTRRFAWMLPKTRPMDNVALDFQSPQEDEFAPLLVCFLSSYLGISFPRREDHYNRYLTFHRADSKERETWCDALEWFLKKLTLKYGGDRALVLKSPPHTARIRMLLARFPEAKFIHIHRHPEQVFSSFRHFYDTAMWHTYLQKPDRSRVDEEILARYRELYEAYFADLPLIPAGQFAEVSFEEVEKRPVETVKTIYERLSVAGFESARPGLERYVGSLGDYQKNRFSELNSTERDKIRAAWSGIYSRWGYQVGKERA